MKYLIQEFNFKDDSISYWLRGNSEPTFRVDCSGYLTKDGKEIGEFKLSNEQWHLYIGDELYMSQGLIHGGVFKLPEFELKALTSLINQEG